MKKMLIGTLLAATLFIVKPTFAQEPVYQAGPVWRVVYYRFLPGQAGVFWSKLYPELKTTMAIAKKQGEIVDAQFFANPLKSNPKDWDIELMLKYPNYAALDGLGAKSDKVYKEQFSPAQTKENVKERAETLEVLSVHLVRQIPLK